MNDINSTFQSGNLVKDAETKIVNQTSVTTFTIANNYSVKVGDQWEKRAYFFNVNVWGKQGEHVAKFLKKGKKCTVAGRLQQRVWTDKTSGEKKYAVDIIAEEVQFEYPPRDASANNLPPQEEMPPPTEADYGYPPEPTGHGVD